VISPKHRLNPIPILTHLTREVFSFERCEDGNLRLFIGTKTNNIGYLSFKAHGKFEIPNSLYVRKERGQYYVSFCYEDGNSEEELPSNAEHLEFLQGSTKKYLEEHTIGVDRGVAIPVHAGSITFDFCENQKSNMTKADRYIKRLQRKLSRKALAEETKPNIALLRTMLKRRIFETILHIKQVVR